MQNFDHNIGFWEKRQFFRQKLSKIAENCDHNIDPWCNWCDFKSATFFSEFQVSELQISERHFTEFRTKERKQFGNLEFGKKRSTDFKNIGTYLLSMLQF
jgi:hypothetical protein